MRRSPRIRLGGDHDASNVVTLPRSLFPAEAKLEPGLRLAARTSAGQNYPITVVEVHSENVIVDLNHPLAGRRLFLRIGLSTCVSRRGSRRAGARRARIARRAREPLPRSAARERAFAL